MQVYFHVLPKQLKHDNVDLVYNFPNPLSALRDINVHSFITGSWEKNNAFREAHSCETAHIRVPMAINYLRAMGKC